MTRTHFRQGRKGGIAPLTAVLLMPLMAMLAFAIDIGWITHTHNQLQAAADAAALAGAGQLTDNWVRYHLPAMTSTQKTSIRDAATDQARTYARNFAGYNVAGDVSSLNLPDADVEFGHTDSAGNYTPMSTTSGYPNTCKVVMRRDSSANGALPMFFARVLGISTVDLNATASACIYAGQVDGFQTNTTFLSRILPMTYDVNDWNSFLQDGKTPGGNSVDRNAAGEPQLQVYPSIKDTGNFGELSLDQSNNGASTISGWIDYGVTADDLKADYTKGLLPLSDHNANSNPDWKGNPGLKTSTIHTTGDHVGELYLLPLFKPVKANKNNYQAGEGNGSNYYYTIVQFVGVKISDVDNKGIKVVPSSLIDPNALLTNVTRVTTPSQNSPLPTTFVGARLVR